MATIKEILEKNNFRFNKQFGQNFITDTNLLKAIVADSGVTENDIVLEIGAGAGTLTRELALVAKKVVSFEIDRYLAPVLQETLLGLEDKVEVIFEDFQKVDDERLKGLVGDNYKVVANLPYYITTPLIMRFLECENQPQSIAVMVQKEVGERIVAKADCEEFGAITLSVALVGNAKIARIVPRTVFTPMPSVDSCILTIELEKEKFVGVDKVAVKQFIRAGFSMRRKTLVNNLLGVNGLDRATVERALTAIGVDIRARAETLDIFQFVKLTEELIK